MYEFSSPGLYDGRPLSEEEELETTEARLKELGEAIHELWKWQWEERVEEQWEGAETRFAKMCDGEGPSKETSWKDRLKNCLIM